MQNFQQMETDISKAFNTEINSGGVLTSLSNLDITNSITGLFDEWLEVKCPDKTKALVLKNPNKAFELYAKQWTSKFGVVVDVLEQAKIDVSADVKNKVEKLFENLNYVEAILREAYKSAYLSFAGSPCSLDAQAHKHRMDKIILVASLQLGSIKLMLDTNGLKKIDELINEVLQNQKELQNAILRTI